LVIRFSQVEDLLEITCDIRCSGVPNCDTETKKRPTTLPFTLFWIVCWSWHVSEFLGLSV